MNVVYHWETLVKIVYVFYLKVYLIIYSFFVSVVLDVENALIALIEIDENLKATSQRLKNAQKVEELTRFRYNAGKDTLLNYLDAQQSRRNIEEEFLTNRYERLRRMVNLYLAIGS